MKCQTLFSRIVTSYCMVTDDDDLYALIMLLCHLLVLYMP